MAEMERDRQLERMAAGDDIAAHEDDIHSPEVSLWQTQRQPEEPRSVHVHARMHGESGVPSTAHFIHRLLYAACRTAAGDRASEGEEPHPAASDATEEEAPDGEQDSSALEWGGEEERGSWDAPSHTSLAKASACLLAG